MPALVASLLPALVAYDLLPWPRQIRQCLAVALWGLFVLALRPRWPWRSVATAADAALQAALALVVVAALASSAFGHLPWSLALQAVGVLVAAMAMVAAGAAAARRPDADTVWVAVLNGLVWAGLASALVGMLQVFVPAWVGNPLVAQPVVPGRASGNLGQSNHLACVLLWAVVGSASLHRSAVVGTRGLALLSTAMALGLALSASRIGAVGLLMLAVWGGVDRRLSTAVRRMLCALPLAYGAMVLGVFWIGQSQPEGWGLAARVLDDAAAPSVNSRPHIWRNTLAMIAAEPLRGVGFGEFNLAWSLTPFAVKPVALFDHSHNLPLQLLVELGLPLGGLVLALLVLAAGQAVRRLRSASGATRSAAGEALVLLSLIGLHSLLEYPLWYAYFLLPAAFFWGFALGQGAVEGDAAARPDRRLPARWPMGVLGLAMASGGSLALWDYFQAAAVWEPAAGGPAARVARLARAQRSLLFAHHADAVAALGDVPADMQALAIARAPHKLLDARLLSAWAQWLEARGQHDLACDLWAAAGHFGPAGAEAPQSPAGFDAAGARPAHRAERGPLPACKATPTAHGWRDFVEVTAGGAATR